MEASSCFLNHQLIHRTVRTQDFPDFWVLGGLRATRTLPVVFRFNRSGGVSRRVIDELPTIQEQDFAYPEKRDKEALDSDVCIRLEFRSRLKQRQSSTVLKLQTSRIAYSRATNLRLSHEPFCKTLPSLGVRNHESQW
jgi:hypothetical protein